MKRNFLLDICKGVLIILVVLGHSIQYGNTKEYFWSNPVIRYIYSFHMPLFMGIAGYFSYFSFLKYDVWKYIIRRWKKLFPPIVFWGSSLFLLHCFKKHAPVFSLEIFIYILTALWFLWALLIVGSIIVIVEKYLNGISKFIVYILIMVLACITPDSYNYGIYKFMFPCFLMGFYTAKYSLYRYFKSPVLFVFSTIMWILLMHFFDRNSFIYTSKFSILYHILPLDQQIWVDIFRYIVALVASVSIVMCCYGIFVCFKLFKGGIISYLGKNSLSIYILSGYIVTYILPYITKEGEYNLFINFLETIIILIICILIKKILAFNKIISKIMLGE